MTVLFYLVFYFISIYIIFRIWIIELDSLLHFKFNSAYRTCFGIRCWRPNRSTERVWTIISIRPIRCPVYRTVVSCLKNVIRSGPIALPSVLLPQFRTNRKDGSYVSFVRRRGSAGRCRTIHRPPVLRLPSPPLLLSSVPIEALRSGSHGHGPRRGSPFLPTLRRRALRQGFDRRPLPTTLSQAPLVRPLRPPELLPG